MIPRLYIEITEGKKKRKLFLRDTYAYTRLDFVQKMSSENCKITWNEKEIKFHANDVKAYLINNEVAGMIIGGLFGLMAGPVICIIGIMIGWLLAVSDDHSKNYEARYFNESKL